MSAKYINPNPNSSIYIIKKTTKKNTNKNNCKPIHRIAAYMITFDNTFMKQLRLKLNRYMPLVLRAAQCINYNTYSSIYRIILTLSKASLPSTTVQQLYSSTCSHFKKTRQM